MSESEEEVIDKGKWKIVEFAESNLVDAVPDFWLRNGGTKVLYPPAHNPLKLMKIICKRSQPQQDWKLFPLLKILCEASTYQEATEKVEIAELTSDIDSEYEKRKDKSLRKCRKKKEIITDGESSSSESQLNDLPKISTKGLEPIIKKEKIDINMLNINEKTSDFSRTNSTIEDSLILELKSSQSPSLKPANNNAIIDDSLDNNSKIDDPSNDNAVIGDPPNNDEFLENLNNDLSLTNYSPCTSRSSKKPFIKSVEVLQNSVITIVKEGDSNNSNKKAKNQPNLSKKNDRKTYISNKTTSTSDDNTDPECSRFQDLMENYEDSENEFSPTQISRTNEHAKAHTVKISEKQTHLKADGVLSLEDVGKMSDSKKIVYLISLITELLTSVSQIKADLKQNRNVCQTNSDSSVNRGCDMSDIFKIKKVIPIETDKQFDILNKYISENKQGFRDKLIAYLKTLGGTDGTAAVRKMLKETIKDEVGLLYSGVGQRGKKNFKKTAFYEIIERIALEKKNYDATKMFVDVSSWLKESDKSLKENSENAHQSKKKKISDVEKGTKENGKNKQQNEDSEDNGDQTDE